MVLYAAVARRAGVRLHTAAHGRAVLLVDATRTPAVALDPGCAVRGSPDAVAWICPHAFAAMQIDALANRFCERGRLDHAIRALG